MKLRLLDTVSICVLTCLPTISWSSLVGDHVQAELLATYFRTSILQQYTASPVQVVDPGAEFVGELSVTGFGPPSPLDFSVTTNLYANYFTIGIVPTNDWGGVDNFGVFGSTGLFGVNLWDIDLPGGVGPVEFDPSRTTGFFNSEDINSISWDNTSVSVLFDLATNGTTYAFNLQAVPIPPALYLFGSGLIGLIGIARKRETMWATSGAA